MKLLSYLTTNQEERLGFFYDGTAYDLNQTAERFSLMLPPTLELFLKNTEHYLQTCKLTLSKMKSGEKGMVANVSKKLSAVPHPPTCRDGYAFRQHVEALRKNRGAEMIPEFNQFPVFYFTNPHTVVGEGEVQVYPDHLKGLDFELEIACVIGKSGKNIPAQKADEFILGYTIMNDLSARTLQLEEMKLNLGPAKGKDFATALGPWLVTKDELEPFKIQTPFGAKYDLRMTAKHNGKLISEGNVKDMNWTFAQIIERASYGVELFPGDVIGSGTVGSGCYAELNGTASRKAKEAGENFSPTWLKPNDTIALQIEGLGTLTNTFTLCEAPYSILDSKTPV